MRFINCIRGWKSVFPVVSSPCPDGVKTGKEVGGTADTLMTSRFDTRSFVANARWACLMLVSACSPRPVTQEFLVIDAPPADAVMQDRHFSWIESVRELSDGRVLVSDEVERSLYILDFRTGRVRKIGTNGNGPGEYQSPGALYGLVGDSTLFIDENVHRWFIVVRDSIVESLDRSSVVGPIIGRVGSQIWGADRSGRVLGVEGFGYKPGLIFEESTVLADSLRILITKGSILGPRAGMDAGLFDTVAAVGGQGRHGVLVEDGLRLFQRISPLADEGQAWLFRDGWTAVAHPEPYRVDWRTPDGRWIRGGPLPFVAARVTRAEKCFTLSRATRLTECRLDLFRLWPKNIPAFVMRRVRTVTPGGTALQAGPEGMLLILRTPTLDAPDNRYDVVDRSGKLRGVIRLPADQMIVGFGLSSLYIVQRDAADRQVLSRHPWPTQALAVAADTEGNGDVILGHSGG